MLVRGTVVFGACLALGQPVLAQSEGAGERILDPELDGGGGEVIDDPELEDAGRIDDPELAGLTGEAEVIDDPELVSDSSDSGVVYGGAAGGDYELHGLFHARSGIDIYADNPREEVWDVQQVAQLEALLRPSDTTRYAIGVRLRHATFGQRESVGDDTALRFELDAMPVAGYLDTTPEPGLHLRVGYQMVPIGLFDALSATNVLSVYDLRAGPTMLPDANEVAQLGATLDWDLTTAFSLKAVYLPFFMPHLVDYFEGDYALMRDVYRPVADTPVDLDPGTGMPISATPAQLANTLSRSRTARAELTRGGFESFAPDPDLTAPQGALRATLRGSAGQISLTGVTALERLPVLLLDTTPERFDDFIDYTRLYVVALDASAPIGPFQTGIELSYTRDRALYGVVPEGALGVLDDGVTPTPATFTAELSDVAQVGLRAEWLLDTSLLVALEGFGAMVIDDPAGPATRWFMFADRRYLYGGVGFIGATLGRFELELGAAAIVGPTLYVQPRIAFALLDDLDIEVGAHFMHGPATPALGAGLVTFGGLYNDIDQVFFGFRYAR